jgi:hypothetical protein
MKPNAVVDWLILMLVLGGPEFYSQPRRPAILIEVFVVFSVPPGECQDSALKLGHDRFPQNPLQFIINHLSCYHRRYIV